MNCLPALLAAAVAITASLLGGCSTTVGPAASGTGTAPTRTAERTTTGAGSAAPGIPDASPPETTGSNAATAAAPGMPEASPPETTGSNAAAAEALPSRPVERASARRADDRIAEQFASAALDDSLLGDIRGGLDIGPGVTLSFAFQQSTFVNHDLAQSIVIPTLTVSPGSASTAAASSSTPSVGIPSLAGFGMTAPVRNAGIPAQSATTIINNGTLQTTVSASAATVQSLVNSGVASIVSTLGNGGVTNVISNTLNNQLVQQVINVQIGITGLSQLLHQSVSTAVMNRLVPATGFH